LPDLGWRYEAAEHLIDRFGNVFVDYEQVLVLNLNQDVKCRGRLALEDGLLGPSAPGLFIGERNRLNPADQIGQSRVQHEILERISVDGGYQLDASLGYGASSQGLLSGPDLVDYDDLGHVIFDGFDHDRMLHFGLGHLHSPGAANSGVGNVAVAGDFIRRIDDYDSLLQVIGEDSGRLTQQRGLANARPSHQEDTLARFHEIPNYVDGAVDGAAYPAGQTDDLANPIAHRRNSVKGSLDSGSVVAGESADPAGDVLKVFARNQ
jgi:hypothetical protein